MLIITGGSGSMGTRFGVRHYVRHCFRDNVVGTRNQSV